VVVPGDDVIGAALKRGGDEFVVFGIVRDGLDGDVTGDQVTQVTDGGQIVYDLSTISPTWSGVS
jgi:hypothetical protein